MQPNQALKKETHKIISSMDVRVCKKLPQIY